MVEIHVTAEQNSPGPIYRRQVKEYCCPVWDSSQKVYVPYGKHCTEGTMMQQLNPGQAVCDTVDSVQLGSSLLSLRRRVYSAGLPKPFQGWENDLLHVRQSHSNLDFIQP